MRHLYDATGAIMTAGVNTRVTIFSRKSLSETNLRALANLLGFWVVLAMIEDEGFDLSQCQKTRGTSSDWLRIRVHAIADAQKTQAEDLSTLILLLFSLAGEPSVMFKRFGFGLSDSWRDLVQLPHMSMPPALPPGSVAVAMDYAAILDMSCSIVETSLAIIDHGARSTGESIPRTLVRVVSAIEKILVEHATTPGPTHRSLPC